LPALNLGTFAALIRISSPVRGLRPTRADRLPTLKVPNPTSVTDWPLFNAPLIAASAPSTAFSDAVFEMPADLATISTISALFTLISLLPRLSETNSPPWPCPRASGAATRKRPCSYCAANAV